FAGGAAAGRRLPGAGRRRDAAAAGVAGGGRSGAAAGLLALPAGGEARHRRAGGGAESVRGAAGGGGSRRPRRGGRQDGGVVPRFSGAGQATAGARRPGERGVVRGGGGGLAGVRETSRRRPASIEGHVGPTPKGWSSMEHLGPLWEISGIFLSALPTIAWRLGAPASDMRRLRNRFSPRAVPDV